MTPSSQVVNDLQPNNLERVTLDSLVVQYLKHQHRQCPAPITTLPPTSLLHPHVCPEPKRSLDAPSNVTARLGTREFKFTYGGLHGNRRDRQFVFSRFRPWRTYRDDAGSHTGELNFFDSNNNNVVESFTGHEAPLALVQSFVSGETQLLLSSCSKDVKLWDATSILGREIVLYDIQEGKLERTLSDTLATSTGRGHAYSLIHFSPDDERLLYNGVLWDPRRSEPVYRFDQFTDYGGGGFHPAGNEQYDGNAIVDRLLQFLEMEKDYVTSEALLLVKDLLRKYPQWSQVCIATVGNISSNNVQEPKAKAALIWMLGGYSQDMHDAPYVLESLVENWDEEHSAEVRLHVLTAVMKCFFKRPPETQKALGAARAAGLADFHQACLLPVPKGTSCANYARCVNQILQDLSNMQLWLRISLVVPDDDSMDANSATLIRKDIPCVYIWIILDVCIKKWILFLSKNVLSLDTGIIYSHLCNL
ncbi:unnamed protein product [Trifolium pratense]|uniref:Uncharacterized protein n=1 Tax=Trifolium pratense TaxID=57577 RepID=A0ACB0IT29_TRIPR|nr:unnamed protein product [Trifolium pratense]